MKSFFLALVFLLLVFIPAFAQQGKNGDKTITTPNIILNEYTSLTVDDTSGSSQITVVNNNLNSNNRFTSALASGDLILIIQVQGATVSGSFYTHIATQLSFFGQNCYC